MKTLPILFGRSELVEGNGFLARVRVSGRALLTEEDGQFWTEGVVPGGLAASGDTREASLAKFCEEFHLVLFDIAADASGFEAFEDEVNRFFEDRNEEIVAEWHRAVDEVRSSKLEVDWLCKRSADTPPTLKATRLSLGDQESAESPSAAHNQASEMDLAA